MTWLWIGFALTLVLTHVAHYNIASWAADVAGDIRFCYGKEEGLEQGRQEAPKLAYQKGYAAGRQDARKELRDEQETWFRNEAEDRRRAFLDLRGQIHQAIADHADRVYEQHFGETMEG
jgi:flagellar biosynthesis/type III secretory pathway protein FliH